MKKLTPIRVWQNKIVVCIAIVALSGCASLSSITGAFDDNASGEKGQRQLSDIEKAEQARLLSGKSSRPSLASLDLMPEGRDIEYVEGDEAQLSEQDEIPALSLAQKKAEYEALLPLITDPVQRRQAAFRLADINMLLAEQTLVDGPESTEVATAMNAAEPDESAIVFAVNTPFEDAIDSYTQVLNQHKVVIPTATAPLSDEQQALNRKQMDAMYQLSRALDLAGQKSQSVEVAKRFLNTFNLQAFAISEQHIELYFRIGEYYFNRREYGDAATYYAQVVSHYGQAQLQNSANFYGISTYMLGWSEFKQDKYNEALQAFDLNLQHSLSNIGRLEVMKLSEIDSLSKGEMRLLQDSIRVMALTFSYQGSGQAIADFYQARGPSDYQHLVFEELAQQYLDEDRFGDSANTLLVFAQNNPVHPRAVEFYVRHIDAYILGGFPDRVLLAKQTFVETYSLGGEVLKRLDSPIGEAAVPYLKTYLTELAQTEHSVAQAIDAILQARASSNGSGNQMEQRDVMQGFVNAQLSSVQSNTLRTTSTEDLNTLRAEAYEQAVNYYENYIRTFTYAGGRYDDTVPQRRFYLAEAYIALNRYQQAITAFETYAYEDTPNPLAVEAAYAAILAYQHVAVDEGSQSSLQGEDAAEVRSDPILSNAQFSQQRFIESFANDRRSPVIALNLMQTLFNSANYIQAQRWALWLLGDAPTMHQLSSAKAVSANLVMAHSEFALENFAGAEIYYRNLLLRPEYAQTASRAGGQNAGNELNTASSRADLIDRLAATLYKQAEQELGVINLTPAQLAQINNVYDMPVSDIQREAVTRAIAFWQTIISDTPSSSFRVNAQFDSASYYALVGQWPQAIETWLDFAQRYPDNPLTSSIEGQLLFAYQQTEDWQAAADLLVAKWEADKNNETAAEIARESLYQAATFYDRVNNRERALDTFRTYAHAYPEPYDLANEARLRLSEFYLASNEDSKRRFWLDKLVQAQLELADTQNVAPAVAGNARSRYLAAMASMVFATDADTVYSRIKLTLPLNESLAKKQSALTEAISAYDRVMSFAVVEYASKANYHLANLYMTLAQDLMASSRPTELSALELSQYDLLLEEQAYPFEETAIELHENNVARLASGLFDEYVKRSFDVLAESLPARYNKQEITAGVSINDL